MTRPWTPADDQVLIDGCATHSVAELAATLKRTRIAVYKRAERIGLRFVHEWETPRMRAMLRALEDGPSTTPELAAEAGTTLQRAFGTLQKLERSNRVRRTRMPAAGKRRRYLWSLPE